MTSTKAQVIYTLILWAFLISGVAILAGGNITGVWLIAAALIMGALRTAYVLKLRRNDNDGGEDEQD